VSQADRPKFITKDEAKQLSEAHPDWTRWILIPANEKDLMLQRINGRLTAEGIPPVEMIILKWRVSQLLRDIQRKYGTSCVYPPLYVLSCRLHMRMQPNVANHVERLAEGSMISGMGGSTSGSQAQADSSTHQSQIPRRSESSPSETRPYDPIRDV
jgi:hypothetical protein